MTNAADRDDAPSWDRVFRDLKELTAREYGGCEFATLVVHIRSGLPDICRPIICRPGDPCPSGGPTAVS